MSVRKQYQVLVDSTTVFLGSYASCMSVYQAFESYNLVLRELGNRQLNIVVAFKPSL